MGGVAGKLFKLKSSCAEGAEENFEPVSLKQWKRGEGWGSEGGGSRGGGGTPPPPMVVGRCNTSLPDAFPEPPGHSSSSCARLSVAPTGTRGEGKRKGK